MSEELAGMRVLIVEDRPSIRELLALAVEGEGMIADLAADVESAEAAARAHPPDIVLLDLLLPGRSGEDLIGWLRRTPGCIAVPVIVLSGAQSGRSRSQAVGAFEFLPKPFDIRTLVGAIRRAVLAGCTRASQ